MWIKLTLTSILITFLIGKILNTVHPHSKDAKTIGHCLGVARVATIVLITISIWTY